MSTAQVPDERTRTAARLHVLRPLAPEPVERGERSDRLLEPTERAGIWDGREIRPAPALRRGSMAGTDIDEARDRYAALFPGTDFQAELGDEPFSYRYSFIGDAHVTLRSSIFRAEHWGRAPALPDYVVGWWREGSGAVDPGLNEVRSSGSRPFLMPAGRSFGFRFSSGVQNLVHMDAGFLEDTATEFHDGRSRPLVFDHAHAPDAEQSTRWRQAVSEASPVLQDADANPLLRIQAGLLVARATLRLYPWHDVPFSAELRTPRMAGVRAAIEYLHHHAHEPVTPADAARSAGISTRVLQLAVRRYEDTTPSALLRGIRLDRVRAQLTDASPSTTTVRAVAEQWGFGHLGRFAASYAERFGELPSATLRG